MGVLAKNGRQATLIYYPAGPISDDLTAYAESSDKKLRILDLSKQNLTGTQWAEIAGGLGKEIADLINREHPDFREEYGTTDVDLDAKGWITVLTNTPKVLKWPILINGNKFIEIERVSQFSQLMDNDSAGIEKRYPNPQEK